MGRYKRIPEEQKKKPGRKCEVIEQEKIDKVFEMRSNRYTLKEITDTTGLSLWKVRHILDSMNIK